MEADRSVADCSAASSVKGVSWAKALTPPSNRRKASARLRPCRNTGTVIDECISQPQRSIPIGNHVLSAGRPRRASSEHLAKGTRVSEEVSTSHQARGRRAIVWRGKTQADMPARSVQCLAQRPEWSCSLFGTARPSCMANFWICCHAQMMNPIPMPWNHNPAWTQPWRLWHPWSCSAWDTVRPSRWLPALLRAAPSKATRRTMCAGFSRREVYLSDNFRGLTLKRFSKGSVFVERRKRRLGIT